MNKLSIACYENKGKQKRKKILFSEEEYKAYTDKVFNENPLVVKLKTIVDEKKRQRYKHKQYKIVIANSLEILRWQKTWGFTQKELSVFLGISLRKTQMILDNQSLGLKPNIVKLIQMYARVKIQLEE